MSYLNEDELANIAGRVYLKSIDDIKDVDKLQFDCGIGEYNEFLRQAEIYSKYNISKTHFLFEQGTNKLLGYFALSTDTLKLSAEEKDTHDLSSIPFAAIPALKIGKLAINRKYVGTTKGYGSFLVGMARAHMAQLNEAGIACRFLTVDADIEYDPKTVEFYEKNGFAKNTDRTYTKRTHTVSMRMDILAESSIIENEENIS